MLLANPTREKHPSELFDWNSETNMSWQELGSGAICHWSFYNFGLQVSKATGAELNAEAPFKGIFEEFLEYKIACRKACDYARFTRWSQYPESVKIPVVDSLVDMAVYLLDYAARHTITLELDSSVKTILSGMSYDSSCSYLNDQLEDVLEMFVRTDLKSHQGIRGYTMKNMNVLIFRVLAALSALYYDIQYGPDKLPPKDFVENILNEFKSKIQEVFFNEVYPRDWVKYPGKGKP